VLLLPERQRAARTVEFPSQEAAPIYVRGAQ
jgi:hypothetical protein